MSQLGIDDYKQAIQSNAGKNVCDGSYKAGYSTAAFQSIGDNVIKGQNIVPGYKKDQSLYRVELGGILKCIVLTNAIYKKEQINKGSVTLGCDCEGAIKAVSLAGGTHMMFLNKSKRKLDSAWSNAGHFNMSMDIKIRNAKRKN